MQKLSVKNFKAFRDKVDLECPNSENILVYGENGSGKTSLYEAFHLYYFKDKIFNERIPANVVVNRRYEEDAIVGSFSFDGTNDPMTLSIDDIDYAAFSQSGDEQVFLISYNDLHPQTKEEDNICINNILRKACFKYEASMANWFDNDAEQEIIKATNKILKETFYIDGIELSMSLTGDNICSLEWKGKIHKKKFLLSHFFNEGILHLVRFIILIESISIICDKQKKALVVFDDCFNSLDAANRTFVMRYFLKETSGMQKIVLTHNLSYYNLMSHIVSNEFIGERWLKEILYLVDGNYILKEENPLGGVEDIIKKRRTGYYTNSAQLGNAIRQEFEVLIYRLSILCNIGSMAEASNLLDKMCSPNKNVYFSVDMNQEGETADTLVDDIYKLVTNGSYTNLQKRLKEKIETFQANDILAPLVPTLVELRLLQKVALHQASHGHVGLPPIQSKEFDVSLALLKKIEDAICSIRRKDISTI